GLAIWAHGHGRDGRVVVQALLQNDLRPPVRPAGAEDAREQVGGAGSHLQAAGQPEQALAPVALFGQALTLRQRQVGRKPLGLLLRRALGIGPLLLPPLGRLGALALLLSPA